MRSIGVGATGGVYMGRDRQGQLVACKRFTASAELTPSDVEHMFRRECVALRLMDAHPLVPRLLDTCEADGWWLIEEYIDGHLLSELVGREDRLVALGHALLWVAGLADTLEQLHVRGLVYQDIKPENIIIDGRNWPVLVDYGGVRVFGDVDALFGTDGFLAPELTSTSGHAPDYRTDVYALGLLLYWMVTGRQFTQDEISQGTAVVSIRDFDVRDAKAGQMPRLIRGHLQRILSTCLAPNPNQRYPVLSQFGRDLRRAIDSIPSMVGPVADLQMALMRARDSQRIDAAEGAAPVEATVRVDPAALEFGFVDPNGGRVTQGLSVGCPLGSVTAGTVNCEEPWVSLRPAYFRAGEPTQITVTIEPSQVPQSGAAITAHVTVQYDNHVVHVPCTVNTVAPVEPPPIDPKLRIPRVPPARPGAPAEGPPGASPSPTAVPAAGEGSTVWDSLRDIFEKSRAQDRIVLEVVARPAAAFRALAAIPPTAVPWLVVTEMALCFSVALVVGLLSGSFSSPRAGDAAGTALTLALLLCAVGPGWAAWVYVWRAGHRAACRRLRVELPVEQAQLLIVYATAPQLLAGTGVCFLLGMGLGCGAVPVWPMMVASWLGTIWHLALVAVGTREMTGLGWADATLATALGGGALFLVATQVLIVWAA